MDRKTIIISTIFSIITALVTTLAVFAVFFFYNKPVKPTEMPPIAAKEATPTPPKQVEPSTPPKQVESTPFPQVEIKESDVESLTIETVYKNFYAEGAKCRQTYNEYFKNTDGVGSSSSPCNVKLTFNRDGSADKTIEVRRYDTKAREWKVAEKTTWKAKISDEQFNGLAKLVVNNQAFKEWNDMIMINVSNCKITAKSANASNSPMSNVDEKTTIYLPMVNGFKDLDAKMQWGN